MVPALAVKGLTKKYREFTLGELDFKINPGVVVGLIGPNGAGKTTAINIMAGLVKADAGHTEICGKVVNQNDASWKFDLGYAGDDPVFYEKWSGTKNLRFISQFFPDWSDELALDLARRFSLDLNRNPSELSKGNRAKLYLITVLARKPKLMLFDEPTSGLDPVVRAEVLDVLWEMMESGERSALYSTHILSDVEKIADELIFLVNGKIVLRCPKDDLTDRWRKVSFVTRRRDLLMDGVLGHRIEGERHLLVTPDFEKLQKMLGEMGVVNIEVNRLTIEEIAVNIMRGGKNVADY